MGPKTERLIAVLEQTILLLRENGEDYWAECMAKAKYLLERSDFRGIGRILTVYGGMGSFGDRGVSPKELERAEEGDVSVNMRIDMLSGTIYELAYSIKREVERDERL